jgi:hypothetical protein
MTNQDKNHNLDNRQSGTETQENSLAPTVNRQLEEQWTLASRTKKELAPLTANIPIRCQVFNSIFPNSSTLTHVVGLLLPYKSSKKETAY